MSTLFSTDALPIYALVLSALALAASVVGWVRSRHALRVARDAFTARLAGDPIPHTPVVPHRRYAAQEERLHTRAEYETRPYGGDVELFSARLTWPGSRIITHAEQVERAMRRDNAAYSEGP